jgi:hypothetical protein
MKKLFPLLIILTLALGAVSATSFPAPTGLPPEGNIIPIHTGTDQIKNGNLSVNTFIAESIALFQQQLYINNTNLGNSQSGQKGHLKGSSVAGASNSNIVAFGGIDRSTGEDVEYNTSILGSDTITAKRFLRSFNVAHDQSVKPRRELCADAEGRVVFCESGGQLDVCANIEGVQTNPPSGMVRNLSICEWPIKLPPGLAVSNIGCSMRPVYGGTYDDHVECSVDLNAPNNTGNDARFSITYYYRNLANGSIANDFSSIDVVVPLGEANAISQTKPIDPTVTLTGWCIDMNSAPAGISIPQARQC